MNLKIKLIYEEAIKRFEDGDFLSGKVQSDSGYLLKLLAFELFLKCTLLLEKNIDIKNHKYYGMFCSLNRDIKQSIMGRAQEISQVFTIKERIATLLTTFGNNFIRLRYPYQNYENFTEKEYIEYSKLYAELGCPEGEAEFEYYPEELRGITMALREYVENKIATRVDI